MIKIDNAHVDNIVIAVYSARNAMNSWDKSDSDRNTDTLGKNDLELARKLVKAGSDHRKFMRMINVTMDIVAPLYWWKEFDTYKVGTVANSCSTMHKIADKEFTLDDFSHEHLMTGYCGYEIGIQYNSEYDDTPEEVLDYIVHTLNMCRKKYIETKDKKYWWQMIQLLPSSYNQRRTVQLNYEVLTNMYRARKNHKLDEWREFCDFIESLPYAKDLICMGA